MPTDDKMSIDERRKYLKRMYPRYRDADRTTKGMLLSEMETYTGLHRKSLLRLLAPDGLERQPRRRQRGDPSCISAMTGMPKIAPAAIRLPCSSTV